MKHEIFNSKEQYIEFRKKWRQYINSGKAKKIREKVKLWNGDKATAVTPSPLSSEYHLFYSLARGKGYDGFVYDSEGKEKARVNLAYISHQRLIEIFGHIIDKDFIEKVKQSS